MNQIIKDKMLREIMVVKNSHLFTTIPRESRLYLNSECNFEDIILQNYEYMVRGEAEVNFDYKQPIPYGVVVNELGEIFVYKRGGAGSNAGESRLHQKISIGVGGHLEREDEALENPIKEGLMREIEEEIGLSQDDILSVEPFGYLNNESDEVSQVHIGIVYIIYVLGSNIALLDGEIEKGEFVSIEELISYLDDERYDVESWSEILIPEIRRKLKAKS